MVIIEPRFLKRFLKPYYGTEHAGSWPPVSRIKAIDATYLKMHWRATLSSESVHNFTEKLRKPRK